MIKEYWSVILVIGCAYKFLKDLPSWTILMPTKLDTLFYRHSVNWIKESKHAWFTKGSCKKKISTLDI